MNSLLRTSIFDDVQSLSLRLRAADRTELKLQDIDPLFALSQGYWRSAPDAITVVFDDLPVAMFGIVPGLVEGHGAVWLLGSDELVEGSRFARNCRQVLSDLSDGYTFIYNQVHDQNTVHLRWLQWMGFKFSTPNPPFISFSKVIAPCVDP